MSDRLVDYYQAAGNPPGVWVGSGCRDLGMSGTVSEEHLLALFGEALRPDANEFIAERVAAGDSFDTALRAARLGRKFYEFTNSVPLVDDLRATYAEFQQAHGRRDIKERVAQGRWTAEHPDEPAPSTEQLRRYLVDQLGRARQPVAGFDLVFSMVKSRQDPVGAGRPADPTDPRADPQLGVAHNTRVRGAGGGLHSGRRQRDRLLLVLATGAVALRQQQPAAGTQ